ncbi:MAG: hypothetical protein QG670_423 [Thermoproteota archaeon]|nr:hypothetical protein [Thermoproteota archaeon]
MRLNESKALNRGEIIHISNNKIESRILAMVKSSPKEVNEISTSFRLNHSLNLVLKLLFSSNGFINFRDLIRRPINPTARNPPS